jgi:formate-dependent nitrite reductase membrane component NrfD
MSPEIDRYVADPDWGILIVLYLFLGGLAAGAYVTATFADLFGDANDRRSARAGYYLALPLLGVCGLLLIADLGRPERFWHMMIQSNTGWPMFKWWSPMSAGSWALSIFGGFSFVSWICAMAEDGQPGFNQLAPQAARLRHSFAGLVIATGGTLSAFFVASYTGVLLSSSNQPIWANTTWTGALFLASALSTGVAAIVVWNRRLGNSLPHDSMARLESFDAWAIGLELLLLTIFIASLGRHAAGALSSWPGILVPTVVIPVGLIAPLALRHFRRSNASIINSLLVLIGGFALRAAVGGMPASFLLARHH